MKKIRLSLDVIPAMKELIETLARDAGINQGEMLRRSIALYRAVKEGEKKGEQVAMVKDGKILYKMVGH